MGNGDILVTVESVPEGEFVVFLRGTDKVSNSNFQRQSTTQMSVSKVIIQVGLFTSSSCPVYRFRFFLIQSKIKEHLHFCGAL